MVLAWMVTMMVYTIAMGSISFTMMATMEWNNSSDPAGSRGPVGDITYIYCAALILGK